jgi:hypothetical protein
MQVALVRQQASLDLALLDPNDLDPEVPREGARDPLAEQLRGYQWLGQRSSAVPS